MTGPLDMLIYLGMKLSKLSLATLDCIDRGTWKLSGERETRARETPFVHNFAFPKGFLQLFPPDHCFLACENFFFYLRISSLIVKKDSRPLSLFS